MNSIRSMSPDDLKMPACHSADIVLLMADRYTRASAGMIEWATLAKQCIEFFEGKQWSEAALKAQGRGLRGNAQATIPLDVLYHAQRDLIVATSTMGGYTVGTDMMGGSFIDVLRNNTYVVAATLRTAEVGLREEAGLDARRSGASSGVWGSRP